RRPKSRGARTDVGRRVRATRRRGERGRSEFELGRTDMGLNYLRPAWAAFKMNILSQIMDSFFVFATLLMPLIYALIAFGILRDKGAEYAIYIAIGSGLAGLWSTLLFGSGNAI